MWVVGAEHFHHLILAGLFPPQQRWAPGLCVAHSGQSLVQNQDSDQGLHIQARVSPAGSAPKGKG